MVGCDRLPFTVAEDTDEVDWKRFPAGLAMVERQFDKCGERQFTATRSGWTFWAGFEAADDIMRLGIGLGGGAWG